MKVIVLCMALLGLACQVKPVISTPQETEGSSRYDDCKRASRDYCRDSKQVAEDEMRRCVSRATYECVSTRAR